MRGVILSCVVMFAGVFSLFGQSEKVCGTHEHLLDQIRNNPEIEQLMERYEARLSSMKQDAAVQSETVYTIPLVFHIIYNRTEQNVSDARINELVAVLNRDFAGMNQNTMGAFSPSMKADVKVQFCLAKTAPDGSTTTGIERRQTPVENFHHYQSNIKRYATGGMDAWDPNVYFNIWVCATDGLSFGVFPGSGINGQYGAVVHHDWIVGGDGRNNSSGAVASHEVGHCLNLRHTWGDDQGACTGSDQVDDTPNLANYSSTHWAGTREDVGKVITDNCTGSSPGIMYMNFMDYGYDYTYANFTPGQRDRMRANLVSTGALYALSQSTAGSDPSACTTPTHLSAVNIGKTDVTLKWTAMQNAQSYNVRYRKQGVSSWTSGTTSTESFAVTGLTRNTGYEFQVAMVGASCTSDYSYIALFRTSRNDPPTSISAPTLSAPADGATGLSTTPTLSWNTVSGVEEYRCQFSTSSDFSNAITLIAGSAATSRTVYDLMYGTTYYWRVQARTADLASDWSQTRSFTTTTGTIATPTMVEPADNATMPVRTAWLQWTIPTDAVGVVVQLSQNADMSNATEWYRDLAGTRPKNLSYGTTYYWRVKGVTGTLSSAWSAIRSFTTADSTLQPPTLALPGNNAQEEPVSTHLVWRPEPSATSYAGEYSTSSTFVGATTFTATDTSFALSSLPGATKHYWRVRSVNASGNSGWSETRYFTTIGTSTTLAAPSLTSPSNNSTNVSKSPTLSWSSVANATGYVVQYATSSSMSPNTEATTSATSYALSGLAANTTYYWRVKATASGYSDSDWSSTWSFKTAKGGRAKTAAANDQDGLAGGDAIVSVYPVPMETHATIEISLAETTEIRLVIVSSIGGQPMEIFAGTAEEGLHHFTLNADVLASGLYYCQLLTAREVVSTPFTVLK